MLKEGIYNYSLTAGQARPIIHTTARVCAGEFRYGLNNTVTLYTGGIAGKDYRSLWRAVPGICRSVRFLLM